MLDEFSLFNMSDTSLLKSPSKIQIYYQLKQKTYNQLPKAPIKDNQTTIIHY